MAVLGAWSSVLGMGDADGVLPLRAQAARPPVNFEVAPSAPSRRIFLAATPHATDADDRGPRSEPAYVRPVVTAEPCRRSDEGESAPGLPSTCSTRRGFMVVGAAAHEVAGSGDGDPRGGPHSTALMLRFGWLTMMTTRPQPPRRRCRPRRHGCSPRPPTPWFITGSADYDLRQCSASLKPLTAGALAARSFAASGLSSGSIDLLDVAQYVRAAFSSGRRHDHDDRMLLKCVYKIKTIKRSDAGFHLGFVYCASMRDAILLSMCPKTSVCCRFRFLFSFLLPAPNICVATTATVSFSGA